MNLPVSTFSQFPCDFARRFHRDQSGGVLIMVAASIFAILGVAALAVDAGYLVYVQSNLQATANLAALAGRRRSQPGQETRRRRECPFLATCRKRRRAITTAKAATSGDLGVLDCPWLADKQQRPR